MSDDLESPEDMRALWCAVIIQAMRDALGANSTTSNNEAREALHWIRRPNDDFDEVCSLAGLDPDAVRDRLTGELNASKRRPGGRSSFSKRAGTGGGRHAQDISELEFSK